MSIVLHHLEKSRSHRILWLMEELGLDYEIKRYARDPDTMRGDPALRELHPLGKSPLLQLDGTILAESAAILETVLDRHGNGRLRPAPDTPEFQHFRYWLHYAEGSLMAPLLVSLVLAQMQGPKVPFIVRPIARALVGAVNANFTNAELERHFAFIEQHLAAHDWFAGAEFSGADIQMSYPVSEGRGRAGITPDSHPRIHDWLGRIQARDAWKRAVERGGDPSFVTG